MGNLGGWYSGKYDSTKQRKVIMTDGWDKSLTRYTASLRFEMLIAGRVVVTDAQWYDGMFFSLLSRNEVDSFASFINFIKKGYDCGKPPFEIRRRNNHANMFISKQFLFSSIPNRDFQDFIYHLQDKYAVEVKDCKTINEYLDCIKAALTRAGRENLLEAFDSFSAGLQNLDSVDSRLFVPWGTGKYIPDKIAKAKPILEKMLEENFRLYIESNNQKIIDKDSCEQVTSIINEIKNILAVDYPKRSEVVDKLESLRRKTRNNSFKDEFMHIFDDYYNCAIALQHECKYYDLSDAANASINRLGIVDLSDDKNTIPDKLIAYLGGIDWNEFCNIYYDNEVALNRDNWLAAFDKKDIDLAKKEFLRYLDCIMTKIHDLKMWIVENSVFYRTSGTKRFILKKGAGKMVGGASSEAQTDADEICLFFGDINDISGDKIVRYASTEDTTKIFDTVFASIEQVR